MPISSYTSGENKVLLTVDSQGREVAKELDDVRYGKRGFIEGMLQDEEHEDELVREFGSTAAHEIRHHLYLQRMKLESGKHSPLENVESQLRSIDRITAAQGSTQDLALTRRSKSESRDYYRYGSIPSLHPNDANGEDGMIGGETEVGKGRRFHAQGQFSKNSTVLFPYGKQRPSPTYHSDYPTGSGVGDNPNDDEEEKWLHELNKLIYEEEYNELHLGELEDGYTPVHVQKEDMDAYMKEKDRVKKYNLLDREDRSVMDREEKEDEILEMIKRGDDPNQEAFGPW